MPALTCSYCGTTNNPERTHCCVCDRPFIEPAERDEPAGQMSTSLLSDEQLASPAGVLVREKNIVAAVLLILAILHAGGATLLMIAFFREGHAFALDDPESCAVLMSYGFGALFLLLLVWSRRHPSAASVAGFSLFGAIQILGLILQPEQVYSGLLMKALLFLLLLRGLLAGDRYREALAASQKTDVDLPSPDNETA